MKNNNIHIEEIAKKFANNVPKSTNYNNTKSRKYFSTKINIEDSSTSLTLKDNLLHKVDNNNNIPTESIKGHHKKKSSIITTVTISKEISKTAFERRSLPKVFYKIPAKLVTDEDIILSEDEEIAIVPNIVTNIPKQNRTIDHINKKKIEDSINKIKEKLNTTDIDLLSSTNILPINIDILIKIEKIYSIFIKELEMKKNKQSDYDSLIIQFFEVVMSSYESIYELENSINDKLIQSELKKYFLYEIIIFGLCFMRGIDKPEKILIYNAFKNCFFFLNQNLIILIFICTMICKNKEKIVEDNKIWLNKSNYRRHLKNNNKAILNIIKNILKHIKEGESLTLEVDKDKEREKDREKDICLNFNNVGNLSVIVNYIKNKSKFKTKVVRDNLYRIMIEQKLIENKIDGDYNISIDSGVNPSTDIDGDIDIEALNNSSNVCNNNGNDNPSLNNGNADTITTIDTPFLPEKINHDRKYTLVLDLDETLVHYVEDEESAYIQIRPGAEIFLEEMFHYFEIVVFTAAMQDYADLVLDELDKNNRISHRLYRQHTINTENCYIKDLSKLGRNLSRTLIIDNVAENYQLQKTNGLNIKNFEGDENDNELIELSEDLKRIVIEEMEVFNILPSIQEKMCCRNNYADSAN